MSYNPKMYPVSWAIAAAIAYLSLFKPPSTGFEEIPYFDKIVHVCMYAGWSCCIWFEYALGRKGQFRLAPAIWRGCAWPIAFSGCMELLQEYATDYRSGDWADFAANICGTVLGAGVGYFVIHPYFISKHKQKNG